MLSVAARGWARAAPATSAASACVTSCSTRSNGGGGPSLELGRRPYARASAMHTSGCVAGMDYSSYLSRQSKLREPSPIRALQPLVKIPGMISLGGGMVSSHLIRCCQARDHKQRCRWCKLAIILRVSFARPQTVLCFMRRQGSTSMHACAHRWGVIKAMALLGRQSHQAFSTRH